MENSLTHHGIKGMRWGVRRYQNSDGSLTDVGKRRLRRDRLDNNDAKREANPDKWVRDDIRRTKGVVDATANMSRELGKANDKGSRNVKKKNVDLSSMSDKELRDAINRASLERQYTDFCVPQNTSKGREYAGQVLEAAGTALAITSSALAVALAIKELRG